MAQRFDVEEVMIEEGDWLALSLGFISPDDPLDTLHFVTGRRDEGGTQLYVERTDQSLACSGEVIRLACEGGEITLSLTELGARSLQLEPLVRFRFDRRPDLFAIAARQLSAMAHAGLADIIAT